MAERARLHLVQFTREPVPGSVKTRMHPALSPTRSCELHRELTLWTLRSLCSFSLGGVARSVEVSVAGNPHHPFFTECQTLGDITLTTQSGGDLGARMYAALAAGLDRAHKVILVGSDCPAIDASYLNAAVAALDTHEVVLGPALDGGYVLIGARDVRREWFDAIAWGSGAVFEATAAALNATGTGFAVLAALADIDRPEDLELWHSIRQGANAPVREPHGSGAEGG